MSDPLLIGIDVGTTNGKAACYDITGRVLAQASHTYPTHFPRTGWYEQNPNDWVAALRGALREVSQQLGGRATDVAGLALSNHVTGLVLLDKNGVPLAGSPTWQDKRFTPQGKRLVETIGSNWVGMAPPLSGFPAKLLWYAQERPDLVAKAELATDNKGFLFRWLA